MLELCYGVSSTNNTPLPNLQEIVFMVDGKEIRAEVAALKASASPVFQSMFGETWAANFQRDRHNPSVAYLAIPQVDPGCFETLIRFVEQKRKVNFTSPATALGVLIVSLRFLVIDMALHCLTCLQKLVTHVTALEILNLVMQFCPNGTDCVTDDSFKGLVESCDVLVQRCLHLIAASGLANFKMDAWTELCPEALRLVLGEDKLAVPCETDVFMAVIKWATCRCGEDREAPSAERLRSVIPDDILFAIRYASLKPNDLIMCCDKVHFTPEESAFLLANVVSHKDSSHCFQPPLNMIPFMDMMCRPRAACRRRIPSGSDTRFSFKRSPKATVEEKNKSDKTSHKKSEHKHESGVVLKTTLGLLELLFE